ncbi:TadE/TadG family type IV pilus assembly protein [Geminicoccaceae bacterium 1502E]|nr:TadE/TadG family type IV pilus assembly protein [Geminicoccaceae bacterium 1502E]
MTGCRLRTGLTRRVAGGLAAARRGVIAVEAALVMPVLMLMLLGMADLGWLALADYKVTRIAATLADLTARSESVTRSDLDDVFSAAGVIAEPFSVGDEASLLLSLVANEDGKGARVIWQEADGSQASRIGRAGGGATLGGDIAVARGERLVVAEAMVTIQPLVGLILRGPQALYARSYQRPRFGQIDFRAEP